MTDWQDVIDPHSTFTKHVRNSLATQGYELTPYELVHEQKTIISKLRASMIAKGHNPPQSDQAMFDLVMRTIRKLNES